MTLDEAVAKAPNVVARATGRPLTFVACCLPVVARAASGPAFHVSDTWQLVINKGATIITFLMVFLIQSSEYRKSAALHLSWTN